MRVVEILQKQIEKESPSVHRGSFSSLFRAVTALVCGGKLWLAALGRSMPGETSAKHSIKAVDRLLGSRALYRAKNEIYSGLCATLLQNNRCPVVLVDATDIYRKSALVASLAFDGRSLAIFSIVGTKKHIAQRRTRRRFLKQLREILPAEATPILVTDAGFESTWFEEVEALGWHYVGRVRKRTKFRLDDEWVTAPALHKRATNRATNLGKLAFPRCRPTKRRIVLSKERKLLGRKRRTRSGKPGKRTNDRRYSKSCREPWLLTTSLTSGPSQVVKLYSLRMQIEETFRDAKNHKWGWAFDQMRSRSKERVEILLLIAAIASVILNVIGRGAETADMQRRYQANTLRKRRVLSLPVLAIFLLRRKEERLLSSSALRAALTAIRQQMRSLSPVSQ